MKPPRSRARIAGIIVLTMAAVAAVAAPVLAPYPVDRRFDELLNAPPTVVRIWADGHPHAPFIHAVRRVSQLEQRYEEDPRTLVPLVWFQKGRLVSSADDGAAPLLLLGADGFGRDVFSRLLFGARLSLGLSIVAAAGALLVGATIGGIAGYAGRAIDDVLMRAADFVVVLPATYVALALRSVMPLVLSPVAIFGLLSAIFALLGAPFVARGVRAIIRSERHLDYAVAAMALGASHARILGRHLLPATRGFVIVQLTVLVPAFIVAEATLSYVGLGFPDPVASWGTMLNDAANVRAMADFPWLLSPAIVIFAVVLAVNLVLQQTDRRVRRPPVLTRLGRRVLR